MVSGLDLVEWQLRVAAGQPLPATQAELSLTGNALEARIYAERPGNNYLPATGRLIRHRPPAQSPSVRVDSGITQGDTISTFYDPMIAKLITYGPSRDVARQLMDRALEQYQVVGLPTNIEFLRKAVKHPAFAEGGVDTGFLERYAAEVVPKPVPSPKRVVALAALSQLLSASAPPSSSTDAHSPWSDTTGSRPIAGRSLSVKFTDSSGAERTATVGDSSVPGAQYAVTVDKDVFHIRAVPEASEDPSQPNFRFDFQDSFTSATFVHDGNKVSVLLSGGFPEASYTFEFPKLTFGSAGGKGGSATIITPMPGRVVKVSVAAGAHVEAGTTLMILEAMKMEHTIKAPFAGTVQEVRFTEGGFVQDGDVLVKFADAKAAAK